jgi:ABC-type bacteriocin/lantibiotic exporter with double-glycine peptidase domain
MPRPLAGAVLFGTLWMVTLAFLPVAIGRAVDAMVGTPAGSPDPEAGAFDQLLDGLAPFGGSLWGWLTVILALGAVRVGCVGLLEYCASILWVRAAVRVQRAVLAHATRVGAALPRKIRAGEVVAIGSSDVHQIGNAFEAIGRLVGSLVAFGLAVAAVMTRSPLLGTVVLVGVPLATAGLAPLLGPLLRRTEAHREQVGAATTIAADIVAGLRVLRGIGGERRFADRFAETSQRVRRAGVRAGRIDSWLSGIEVLLPGLVTVAVTWLGARLALGGALTVGELVACYGVSAFLVIPVAVAAEAVHTWSGALVAAGRALAVLRLCPEPHSPPAPTALPRGPLGLRDPETGLVCPPGTLTVVRPAGSAHQLADRLGRFEETSVRVTGRDGEVALRDADLAEVRRRVVVAHSQDVLFSGRLADEVQLDGGVDLDIALWAADADDVVAGLPAGVWEPLTERGGRLSGGQRQRLMLARALTADAEVLVLDEPTSAVDAHTEARIARRVAELRRGRTTVVITASPLWAAVGERYLSDELSAG